MPGPSSSNADSLKLLTAQKKEGWRATADSLPQAVTFNTVIHIGIEPTTFRLLVRHATNRATESETSSIDQFDFSAAVCQENY